MKKILKYSTIIGTAAMLTFSTTATTATADTGGYVRVKGFDSHFQSLGFKQTGCKKRGGSAAVTGSATNCKFASEQQDNTGSAATSGDEARKINELKFQKDDGEGLVVGADFGFFRLELEGTYQKAAAKQWRASAATDGSVHQLRVFGNVVVEPFDLLHILGEFGGVDALVKYNPATYGISPYAMYGLGIMGGLVEELGYTRSCSTGEADTSMNGTCLEKGAFGGGATTAVNVGAGVNIGLDQLARGFTGSTGATLPEYFKLPIEFSIGYHWQVGLDDLLFNDAGEDLAIDDGGLTYSVGLKW